MSEIVIPDYLKGIVDDTAADMITNTGGSPRISIKGRQFRFILNGEEIEKGTDPIHVVILGVVPDRGMAKTFYIDGYQPGSTDPPDCSSFLGIRPDEWVSSPQSLNCAECPQNKWGSAKSMSGGKAKACKDSKRLMVVKAQDLNEETPVVYIFNVTIASLKALSVYGKFLLTNGVPMAAAITKIEFVDSDFPQVEFSYMAILKEALGKKSLEIAAKQEWLQGLDTKAISAPEAHRQISAPTTPNNQPPPPPPAPTDNNAPPVSDEEILNNWGA